MSNSGTGIMTLSAMACSAEEKNPYTVGVGVGTDSIVNSRNGMLSMPIATSMQCMEENSSSLHSTPVEMSRSSTPLSSSGSFRRARNFWSVHEDTILVSTVIDNTAILKSSDNSSRPRGRFWLHISFELKTRHGLNRNKRQCRDRFNLLFWKAVRDHRSSRGELKRLDALLAQCLTLLYIDKNNVIMLKENAPIGDKNNNPTTSATSSHNNTFKTNNSLNIRETEDTGLHSPARSELSPTMSVYSSVSDGTPDTGYESLAELASGLQQQVSALTQKVEELCGVISQERLRVDMLLKHGIYQPIARPEPFFEADHCCDNNGNFTMAPYLLARRGE
ncbi:LAME_0A07052g1_1 [Lachancea meyersii CBS 8951]|uniref:LAME_0A07052g1_1 n=1 Tax=Lachancea meyersii CBS 8951 TaxID=1266667 RepID=A0A1G4IRA4_9SACH|nr:LAME_0A07052g1_1 [Lachancea meyersii CBS 8951]